MKKIYGAERVRERENHPYLKPYGRPGKVNTIDTYFYVGEDFDINTRIRIKPECLELPEGGNESLRSAVIRIIKRLV